MYWNVGRYDGTKYRYGWIVTLDVLKSMSAMCTSFFVLSWIVTLDVLKCWIRVEIADRWQCWIVTLDVLKFSPPKGNYEISNTLNSNIRCIEIEG